MRGLIISLLVLVSFTVLRADVLDDSASLENAFDEALLDIHGERWSPAIGENLLLVRQQFASLVTVAEARDLWNTPLPLPLDGPLPAAEGLGLTQARLQHVAALQMIDRQRAGDIGSGREWRSIIKLPKFANSVEGAGAWLALAVTAVVFVASRTLLQGLLHYGETLEAVIPIVAVVMLFTFIGSTVRLFQTVGWLPVHPIPGLELPIWMGVWLGLYPTWEGLLIPFGTFAYVGGMWLLVKFTARRAPSDGKQGLKAPPLWRPKHPHW